MHASFRLDEAVPVAPGTSPFHVRGVFYSNLVEDAKTLPGGVERLLDELTDPRVRDFIMQKFQFMGWYDALPALPCAVAFARVRGNPFEGQMREVSRNMMRKLIPSMFRMLSGLGGPRIAAVHAPRLFQTYFDFIDLRLGLVTDHEGTGVVSGIPLYAAPVFVNQILGILSGTLESLGARDVEASYRDLTVSGSRDGFDLVSCRGEFKWHLEKSGPKSRPLGG
jgi:hypothetical protein